MKIFIGGFSWFGGFTESCVRAFELSGHSAQAFNLHKGENDLVRSKLNRAPETKLLKLLGNFRGIGWRLRSIKRELKRHFKNVMANELCEKFINECSLYKPDLIMIICNMNSAVNYEFLNHVKKIFNVPIFCWYTDDPFPNFQHSLCNKLYDHIFVYDRALKSRIRLITKAPVEYLPNAGDDTIFHPIDLSSDDKQKYSCDISFVGTSYLEHGGGAIRGSIIDSLSHRDIRVYGDSQWNMLTPYFAGIKDVKMNNIIIPSAETNKVFNASKINLNILHPQIRLGTSTRTFEIALAGAFQLVEKNDEINKFFELEKEMVCYESAAQLNELVDYYLKNEKERNEIAINSRKRALQEHTFVHRIQTIIKRYEKYGKASHV